MRLTRLTIRNYRSIKRCENMRIEPLQAFVGENNTGKSNILRAISCFLSAGAGGMQQSDFNDPSQQAFIEAEFTGLSADERKQIRQYLIGDRLILQKVLTIEEDTKTGKKKVVSEYHGYMAEPKDWWLSINKIEEKEGTRPKWKDIAETHGIFDSVKTEDGRVTKTSYRQGLEHLLNEKDVEYDKPKLGETQALGIQQNLLRALPEFYLLPAITDYSDEIDRRSSSTVFRRLMGDLSDRILRSDPRYAEIELAISTLRSLLNREPDAGETATEVRRLASLGSVETALKEIIVKLMPTVQAVQLEVTIEETRELFSKGVSLKIDDGVLTDVLEKGHGLQRSVVFRLLQMLIKTLRESGQGEEQNTLRPIILGIEEPELYIHPQAQRLIYNVMKEFAGVTEDEVTGTDQIIYTTHAPAYVDIYAYERIGIVRKDDLANGTIVKQCETEVLVSMEERKGFKLLTSFSLKHNELFFSREIILVEGPEDAIAVIAAIRKLGRISELPDEIGLSVVVTHGKEVMPKFQKILNAFGVTYGVLLELDGKSEENDKNKRLLDLVGNNRIAKLSDRLEDLLGLDNHFPNIFWTMKYFSDANHITQELQDLVDQLLPPVSCD